LNLAFGDMIFISLRLDPPRFVGEKSFSSTCLPQASPSFSAKSGKISVLLKILNGTLKQF
jgi:hypothetical protein